MSYETKCHAYVHVLLIFFDPFFPNCSNMQEETLPTPIYYYFFLLNFISIQQNVLYVDQWKIAKFGDVLRVFYTNFKFKKICLTNT